VRLLLFSLSLLSISDPVSAAAVPSENIIKSCLHAKALPPISQLEIETTEIFFQPDYRPGYSTEYVVFRGKEVGYATSRRGGAILYDGRLHPIRRSTTLVQTRSRQKPEVRLELAGWSLIREGREEYLCVADHFDGLGRSGSFQKVRYAYLLNTRKNAGLFFVDGLVD